MTTVQDLLDCPRCRAALDSPHILGACASVGIERKKPTEQVLREYLAGIHTREHTDQENPHARC